MNWPEALLPVLFRRILPAREGRLELPWLLESFASWCWVGVGEMRGWQARLLFCRVEPSGWTPKNEEGPCTIPRNDFWQINTLTYEKRSYDTPFCAAGKGLNKGRDLSLVCIANRTRLDIACLLDHKHPQRRYFLSCNIHTTGRVNIATARGFYINRINLSKSRDVLSL